MKNNNLPARDECFALIEEYCVPPHIAEHSLIVAKLAVFLAKKLIEKDIAVNVDLVERACLLHDILRVCDFKESDYNGPQQDISQQCRAKWRQLRQKYKGLPHEYAAYEMLKDKYPALALIVRKHRYAGIADENEKPKTWEEKLVYYADKRVMHTRLVSLEERLTDGHKRNNHFYQTPAQQKAVIDKVDPLIYELEKQIFDKLDLKPHEITNELIDSYNKHT